MFCRWFNSTQDSSITLRYGVVCMCVSVLRVDPLVSGVFIVVTVTCGPL